MPNFKYSVTSFNEEKMVKASGRDLNISIKHAREVCNYLRGRHIDEAKKILNNVMEMKEPVPFKRFNLNVGHRKGLKGWPAGRYPVKAAKQILRVIENAESNAENKGLDLERLWVKHLIAQRGPKMKRIFYRAMGRSTPKERQLVHIEAVLEER